MSKLQQIIGGEYTGERALFMLSDAEINGARFFDGESPLKESKNLKITNSSFEWKYPIWYANNVLVNKSTLTFTARSGIWYTNQIEMNDCIIDAPKTFRRSSGITLNGCSLNHADETFWSCKDIKLNNVTANGDYFAMNCENIEVNNLKLDGNYFLDGSKNVVVKDSILNSKDAFWNTENVTVMNSKIIGEYLGWNSKNLTFINCEISSLQGLCYINGLKLVNCKLTDSTLCLEYCENIDAEIVDRVVSIKNPISGVIRVKGVDELIINENSKAVNKDDVKIITEE